MPKQPEVVVVGAGIIGSTVARMFRQAGATVLLLDDRRPNAGTPPSGGHLKPSWMGSMKRADYEPAMTLLDKCWGLIEASYSVRALGLPVGNTTVYRVDIDKVLAEPTTHATATAVRGLEGTTPTIVLGNGTQVQCRTLVLATGAWAHEMLPEIQTKVKRGVSFRVQATLARPFIQPWAPYKQVVAHQQGANEVWVGDGSALDPNNWTDERTAQCRERCMSKLPAGASVSKELFGLRPYCAPMTKGEPCLLRQVGPRVWVVTGAGKSGTIAAGWAARRIINATT